MSLQEVFCGPRGRKMIKSWVNFEGLLSASLSQQAQAVLSSIRFCLFLPDLSCMIDIGIGPETKTLVSRLRPTGRSQIISLKINRNRPMEY
jgi:hypothetical protein